MIARLCAALASRLRIVFYRSCGVRIVGHVSLRAIEVPKNHAAIALQDGVALDRGVTLLATSPEARIEIGAQVYINRQTMIDASESVQIGARTMIGPFCYITDHDHTIAPGAAPAEGALIAVPTRIGERCWLGAQVCVLKGVTIGDGTVVGAGSVVTKSLPPGVIAAGVPARVLREVGA